MFSTKVALAKATVIGAFSAAAFAVPALAADVDIHTGEQSGAYYSEFCPAIQKSASEKNIEMNCKPSKGSLSNIEAVTARPSDFGLAQFDILAHQNPPAAVETVRDDLGKECVFLVSKNKLMTNYGDVVASAEYLNFILPPEKSGHTGTFKYLQKLDPNGLGKATKVTHAPSTEDAITEALTSEDGVAIFVQFPNPDNPHFKTVTENGGHFVPVLFRELLTEEVDGKPVYTAEETEVTDPKWTEKGTKLVTACTPIVLFTGKEDSVTDETVKTIHQAAITALKEAPAEDLRPKEGWFSKIWDSTKSVSATGVEGLLVATEKARKTASPYVNKAKETAKPYVEKAKETVEPYVEKAKETAEPYVEKTKEVTKPYVDAAKEKTGEAIEAAKPTYEKAKEKTKEAYEAAKEKTGEAIEAAKPTYEKAKEKTKEAYEAAKEKTGEAIEAAKPTYEKAKEKTKEAYEATKEKTKELVEAAKPKVEKAGEATKSYYQKAKDYVAGWFASDDEDESKVEKNTEADKLPEAQEEQPAY